ncbi:PI-PLC domain-containing protein [Streptomyces luteolus]|uniref:Phospholipase n=1 Tax=Streptomyces luteolus TaxID=3043615 RepID=A0ABT6T477_9ACTN|nr:phospholipase [Streptomyces sp. B-S-A12]MDI3422666.1 phospholipase [Streptomyces sp. B-S-A12]
MSAVRRRRRTLLPLALAFFTVAMGTAAASAAQSAAPAAQDSGRKPAERSGHSKQRPTWAIAHRVLTTQGVTAALRDGANALEIDATAWKEGWWADHDGTLTSYGDTMADMFDQVAKEHRTGRQVSFVWLDMKNPDWCDSRDPEKKQCSAVALRDLARSKLESQGIRVLYGFYGTEGGSGWKDVTGSLNSKEGVAYSGNYAAVQGGYAEHGAGIAQNQRVMDNGLFSMALKFGSIREELQAGGKARDRGELARTVGWTVGPGDRERAETLLDDSTDSADSDGGAAVDALIYGNRMSCYPDGVNGLKGCGTDDSGVRESLSYIRDYVKAHPSTRRMATSRDVPFGS